MNERPQGMQQAVNLAEPFYFIAVLIRVDL